MATGQGRGCHPSGATFGPDLNQGLRAAARPGLQQAQRKGCLLCFHFLNKPAAPLPAGPRRKEGARGAGGRSGVLVLPQSCVLSPQSCVTPSSAVPTGSALRHRGHRTDRPQTGMGQPHAGVRQHKHHTRAALKTSY